MRSPRHTPTAPLLVAASLAGLVALGACGGGNDDSVGFGDLDATKDGFAAVMDAVYVDAGEDPEDESARHRGLRVEDCLLLDDEGIATLLAALGTTEDRVEPRVGTLFGPIESQQIDCGFDSEDWKVPVMVLAGTTTLTRDQLAARLGENDVFEVVDDEIDGLDPETVLVLDWEDGRSYILVEDDFFVRVNVPTDAVDDEAAAVDVLQVAVAEVERTLQP